MRFRTIVWAALLTVLAQCGIAAQMSTGGSGTNQTTITSKKLTFDYQSRYAVFEENVVVSDPRVNIKSDKLTAIFEKDNAPKTIIASGHVHIVQADKTAVCERAVYQVKGGQLELSGNPVLRRGTDMLKGTVIVFWRDQDKVEGQDVEMVMTSSGDQRFDDVVGKPNGKR